MAMKTIKVPATITRGEDTYPPMTPVSFEDASEADRLLARWADRGAEEVEAVPEASANAPSAPSVSAPKK
ncbi:MAG: hypothetical protein AB7F41_14640 [Methylocystis sp.]|uniref:hypothetical protein n=1 Tax=Methylocystis sp. TaxID=1911079 RepID=UPI003D129465